VVCEDIFRSALKNEPVDLTCGGVIGPASEGIAFGMGAAGWVGVTGREAVVLDAVF